MSNVLGKLATKLRLERRILDRLGRWAKRKAWRRFEEAQEYVGNVGDAYHRVGRLQLELLKRSGCTPESHVLEVGCGCLLAGRHIVRYLRPGRYVGIEPNRWLIDAAIDALWGARRLLQAKRPLFLHNVDFDATRSGRSFDFVISHSILSHAARWQYPLFLTNLGKSLAPSGVIIASIRMTDEHENPLPDSNDPEWVYPGISSFAWETVVRVAHASGFEVEWKKDYRRIVTREVPSNYHDWIALTPAKRSLA